MIPQETTDRIIQTANIVDVIGEFMTLHKKGINYMGCCPFHNERTASFCVSPAKRIYKCFGCGKGGNVISFLTDGQGMSFTEACEYLGRKYNIEIPRKEMTPEEVLRQSRRESISAVLSAAQEYFHEQLQKSAPASEYLYKKRGMDELTAKTFGSGFAPKGWSNLYRRIHRCCRPGKEEQQGRDDRHLPRKDYLPLP